MLLDLKKIGGFLGPLFFFFLSGCRSSTNWDYQDLSGSTVETRLASLTVNPFQNIEIEIRQIGSKYQGYLNVYGRPLPETDICQVQWKSEAENFFLEGELLQGGQRIRLTDQSTQQLIDQLSQGDGGILEIKRYRSEIASDGFTRFFSSHPAPSRGLLNPIW